MRICVSVVTCQQPPHSSCGPYTQASHPDSNQSIWHTATIVYTGGRGPKALTARLQKRQCAASEQSLSYTISPCHNLSVCVCVHHARPHQQLKPPTFKGRHSNFCKRCVGLGVDGAHFIAAPGEQLKKGASRPAACKAGECRTTIIVKPRVSVVLSRWQWRQQQQDSCCRTGLWLVFNIFRPDTCPQTQPPKVTQPISLLRDPPQGEERRVHTSTAARHMYSSILTTDCSAAAANTPHPSHCLSHTYTRTHSRCDV